jgi:DNA polymerase III psi subunit
LYYYRQFMDLNHTILPPVSLVELYRESLVLPESKGETATSSTTVATQSEQQVKTLGNNHKQVLLLVNYDNCVHIPDAALEFLNGILGACKLSMNDVLLINTDQLESLPYKKIQSEFKSRTVILFGVDISVLELPMSFPFFQPQQFMQTTYLCSPPLAELENDKILKSKLWVCLKKIFSL